MSDVQTHTPQALVFTQSAANKVYQLMCEEENINLKLRVYITGGGCSGFQYGFAFEETVNDDDTVVNRSVVAEAMALESEDEGASGSGDQTVQLLVDPMSLTYLMGAEIDYQDDIDGARFIIRNPNAQTTCGCGSSFSV